MPIIRKDLGLEPLTCDVKLSNKRSLNNHLVKTYNLTHKNKVKNITELKKVLNNS